MCVFQEGSQVDRVRHCQKWQEQSATGNDCVTPLQRLDSLVQLMLGGERGSSVEM